MEALMIKKVVLATMLFSLSSVAMADIIYTINAHQEIVLKKVSKKRFEKISSVNTGVEKMVVTLGNKVINQAEQEINIADDKNKFALEVTGKNILKVEDEKEKINTEIEAAIETSLFGSVKSITIDSKTADALYAEAYKRTGVDILKNANYGNVIKSKINSSNIECVAEGDLLKCDQDQELKFTIEF